MENSLSAEERLLLTPWQTQYITDLCRAVTTFERKTPEKLLRDHDRTMFEVQEWVRGAWVLGDGNPAVVRLIAEAEAIVSQKMRAILHS